MPRKINPNWGRWVLASCRDHFDSKRQDIRLFFEGEPINPSNVERAEFRLDGPEIVQEDSQRFRLTVLINILLSTPLTNQTDRISQLTGIFTAAFEQSIPVFRYGDDDVQIGCLRLTKEPIRVNNYGQSNPDINVRQSTIESEYQIRLLGDL